MDLAKIRKKSLQPFNAPGDNYCISAPSLPDLIKATLEVSPVAPVSKELDFFHAEPYSIPLSSTEVAAPYIAAMPNTSATAVAVFSTPMEAILSGRSAAGCDNESVLADDETGQVASESLLEFLCFRVSDEVYGINIMDIKEITKPREVTEVPRAPVFVSGVISLRGTIIPIIDMRIRLGLTGETPTGKERVIVIKNNNSFSGLLVDEVIQVVRVQLDSVEAAPTVLDGIDLDFISGIGRSDGRLIIILNLENIADINLF